MSNFCPLLIAHAFGTFLEIDHQYFTPAIVNRDFWEFFLSRAENMKMCVSCTRDLRFQGQGDPKVPLFEHIFAPIFWEAFQDDFSAHVTDSERCRVSAVDPPQCFRLFVQRRFAFLLASCFCLGARARRAASGRGFGAGSSLPVHRRSEQSGFAAFSPTAKHRRGGAHLP